MPNTNVEFATMRFRGVERGLADSDPCQFGEDCASWLAEELRMRAEVQVVAGPTPGDCGWELQVRLQSLAADVLLRVGLVPEYPPIWRVYIVANRRLLWGLLVSPDQHVESRVAREVHGVLAGAKDISQLCWYESHDFLQGFRGRPAPRGV